jgi:hypothetical protein
VLAFVLAALAASTSSPALEISVPWWERVTVTVDDKGKQQSCQYEVSLVPAGAKPCDEELAASLPSGRGPTGRFSKMTFERRFSPGRRPDSGQLPAGDELLGRKVLFLTFDADGSLSSCDVVAATGDMAFRYDCEQARKEQFRVLASAANGGAHQAFMTVLAYGHSEHIA